MTKRHLAKYIKGAEKANKKYSDDDDDDDEEEEEEEERGKRTMNKLATGIIDAIHVSIC